MANPISSFVSASYNSIKIPNNELYAWEYRNYSLKELKECIQSLSSTQSMDRYVDNIKDLTCNCKGEDLKRFNALKILYLYKLNLNNNNNKKNIPES